MKTVGYLKRKVNWSLDYWNAFPGHPRRSYSDYSEREKTVARVPVVRGAVRIVGYERGRSRVTYRWETSDATTLETTGSATKDMIDAIQTGEIVLRDGWFHGTFTFAKRGSSITLRVAQPGEWEPCENE